MKTFVRLYNGYQFFFSLLLWVPIFYEYQKRMGLTDAEIFWIQSVYYIAFCVLEIPTGLIADRWGHLKCLKVSSVVLVLSNVFAVAFTSMNGFLAHFLLVALARSFNSGASSAYLYEYLKTQNRAWEYKQVEGRSRAYGLVGRVVGWAGIGLMTSVHISIPYWLTGVAALISVVFAWMLPKPKSDGVSQKARPAFNIKPVLRILAHSPFIIVLMLQGIASFVLARLCQVNLFQPILDQKEFSPAYYGPVMSLMTIFEALGNAYPGMTKRVGTPMGWLFVLTLLMAGGLSTVGATGWLGTLFGLSLFAWTIGLSFPIQRQLLNDAIPNSDYRATILSVESIIDRAACAWVVGFLGVYVSSGRIAEFLYLSSAISIAGVTVLYGCLKFFRSAQPITARHNT